MTFLEHLKELRLRIIISCIALLIGSISAFLLFDRIINILFMPFASIDALRQENRLFINTIFEGFITKIKLSVISGLILSSPVHLYNAIRFIFPGLTSKEKKAVIIGLAVSFILILSSFYYAYYRIVPVSVRFLTGDQFIPKHVGLLLNYNRNIFYVLQLIVVTLIIFQTPILLEVLLYLGVVTRSALLRSGRFVVVGVFILSAIITPPDFISQISIAVPLIGLYFLSILIARIFRFGEGE